MSGDLRGSGGTGKGPAPLQLGKAGEVAVEAREQIPGMTAALVLPALAGEPGVTLTKRGAGQLIKWLTAWAQPPSRVVLWGVEGIATECKVSRATVYNWTRKPQFPKPVKVVGGNGDVWEAEAVKAWVRHVRPDPKGGRPRKQKPRRT